MFAERCNAQASEAAFEEDDFVTTAVVIDVISVAWNTSVAPVAVDDSQVEISDAMIAAALAVAEFEIEFDNCQNRLDYHRVCTPKKIFK